MLNVGPVLLCLGILGVYNTLPSLNIEPDFFSLSTFIFSLLFNSSHNELVAVPQFQDLFIPVFCLSKTAFPDIPPNLPSEPSSGISSRKPSFTLAVFLWGSYT